MPNYHPRPYNAELLRTTLRRHFQTMSSTGEYGTLLERIMKGRGVDDLEACELLFDRTRQKVMTPLELMAERRPHRERSILLIGANDPTAGAGLTSDVRVASMLGMRVYTVCTGVTSQNPQRFNYLVPVSESCLEDQLRDVLQYYSVDCVKIGMIDGMRQATAIARVFGGYKMRGVVIDPIYKPTQGLVPISYEYAMVYDVFKPFATLYTPNFEEFQMGFSRDNKPVFIKSVPSAKHPGCLHDTLIQSGRGIYNFKDYVPMPVRCNHGSGCVISTMIASYLGQGLSVKLAVLYARRFLREMLRRADENARTPYYDGLDTAGLDPLHYSTYEHRV